jgi:hypothetical protein
MARGVAEFLALCRSPGLVNDMPAAYTLCAPVEILPKIKKVLTAERNDAQLDRFLSEVRDSLASSNRQFLAYGALIVGSIVAYHLLVYGHGTVISFNGVQVTDLTLLRRVFLVVPAAWLAAMASVGYLRRVQREVFDFLAISRYQILGATGLHELRLPADHVLGLFLVRIQEGLLGKIVSGLVAILAITVFAFGPAAYVIFEALKNIVACGMGDVLCLASSVIAIILCVCSVIIVIFAGRIQGRPGVGKP